MSLQELMSSSKNTLWVILALLVALVAHTVILLIYLLTSRKSSTQKKQLSKASLNCLAQLESCLTMILPNLSSALKMVLMNKGWLTLPAEESQTEEPQTEEPQTEEPLLLTQIMEVITNYEHTKKH